MSVNKNFKYFKNWAIHHLKKQLKDEKTVCKAFYFAEMKIKKSFGIGTIRTWKGKDYIKGADKKWRPYYKNDSRGKKMAVAAIVRQINALEDGDFLGLWNIIKNNKSRFSNENGKPESEVIALYKMLKEKGAVGNGRLSKKKKKNERKESDKKKIGLAKRLRDEFTENTNKYVGKKIPNKSTGIEAVFSSDSQKEIRSNLKNSKKNGFTVKEHFEVANQIIDLFKTSTLENEHADTKNGKDDVRTERYLSKELVLSTGKKVRACITVKHSLDKNGRNIYSLETMDVETALIQIKAKGKKNASSQDEAKGKRPINERQPNGSSIPQTDIKSSAEYKYNDSDEQANNELFVYNLMFDTDDDSDYYEAIKENNDFKISEFSNKYLESAINGFNEQITYNKEKEKKLVHEYQSISSRKGSGKSERMEHKKELSEDIQFYKQKGNLLKQGLKKIQDELNNRNKIKKSNPFNMWRQNEVVGTTEYVYF